MHSEAELDAALAAIDHKLHHETVPLAVEKRLIADHKKLSQQRERVWFRTGPSPLSLTLILRINRTLPSLHGQGSYHANTHMWYRLSAVSCCMAFVGL